MSQKIILLISISAVIYFISGCCKAECINRTLFVNFNKLKAVNTDSVSVLRYASGNNFTQKQDSTFIHSPVPAGDTSYSQLYRELYADNDWKIINHSLNIEYRLNNFEVEKLKCCGEKAYVVRSYSLNGIRITGDYFGVE